MKVIRNIIFLLITLSNLIAFGQVSLVDFQIRGCPDHEKISDKAKSFAYDKIVFGLVRYDSNYSSDTLIVKYGLEGNCSLGDTYDLIVKSDTILLRIGTNISFVPDSAGRIDSTEYEIEIAMCECFHQYTFKILGIPKSEFLYIAFDYTYPGLSAPIVFSTTDESRLSVFYDSDKKIEKQIDLYIENGTKAFRDLEILTSDFVSDSVISESDHDLYKRLIKEVNKTMLSLNEDYLKDNISHKRLQRIIDHYDANTKAYRNQIAKNNKILKEQGKRLKWWLY